VAFAWQVYAPPVLLTKVEVILFDLRER